MTMKKITITVLALCGFFLCGLQAAGQAYQADDVLGIWLNEDQDAHIEVYKEDGKYHGKIIWLKFPIDDETGKPKLDKNNPDEEMQKKPVLGLVVTRDFIYDKDGEYEDGTIYDPKNGKTYSCYMRFEDMDKLKIRGYIGITLIGRTTYWTRVKD
jgi:uncharacterized protein (DUF2147 family)